MGDWLGSKPQREKARPVSCTEIRRRLQWLVPACPCAQQRCSVWGHLGWGCAALGLKGCSSLLLQMGKANSLHSRDISARVSRRCLGSNPSVLAHRLLGVLASSPGACAGVRFGSCPVLVGMLKAAGSAGLRHRLQVSPVRAAAGKTTQGNHSPPVPGACCCWPGPPRKAASQGQEHGGWLGGWGRRRITLLLGKAVTF